MSTDKEILALRSEVAELRTLIAALPANREQPPETVNDTEEVISRRDMLKTGLIATGALVGTVLSGTQAAQAANGDPLTMGQISTGSSRTELRYTGGLLNTNVFTAQDGNFSNSTRKAAIGGYATGSGVHNGVYGYTQAKDNNDTTTGHALIGYAGSNSRSSLYLVPGAGSPQKDNYSHTTGEQRMSSSNLWLCVGAGTPGTWRKLSGRTAAGSFHLLPAPERAYDSRVSQGGLGPLQADTTETVDMSVVVGLPENITGALVNLTIVNPSQRGYAVLWSNALPIPFASSINYTTGDATGNNVTTAVDSNRMAQIYSQRTTEYVVDVIGYYL